MIIETYVQHPPKCVTSLMNVPLQQSKGKNTFKDLFVQALNFILTIIKCIP